MRTGARCARVHADLGAFVEYLLQREHVVDSESGGLS